VHCESLLHTKLEYFRYFEFWVEKYKENVLIISR